jgi:hypothetical protein
MDAPAAGRQSLINAVMSSDQPEPQVDPARCSGLAAWTTAVHRDLRHSFASLVLH